MSVKATAYIQSFAPFGDGTYGLYTLYQSHDSGWTGSGYLLVSPFNGTAITLDIYSAIRSAVQSDMTTNHGVTFGLLDSVRVLNQLIG